MSEQLKKSRDLVTWLVIGGFALYLLVELVRMISFGVQFSFLGALSSYSTAMVGSIFVVVLALVLVWDSVGEPTRALRTQTLVGVIVTLVGAALGLLFGLIGIFDLSHVLDGLLSFFLTIAYAALSAAALVIELRVLSAAPRPQPAQLPAGRWVPGMPGQPQPGQPQPGQNQPGQAPAGWQPQPPVGYPQGQPSAGWQPQQRQAPEPAGYPQGQPSAGWQPQQRRPPEPAGYPQPGGSDWDDGADDRTRLVPRFTAPAGEPARSEEAGRSPADPQSAQAPFWDTATSEGSPDDRGQWAPRSDPPSGQPPRSR